MALAVIAAALTLAVELTLEVLVLSSDLNVKLDCGDSVVSFVGMLDICFINLIEKPYENAKSTHVYST